MNSRTGLRRLAAVILGAAPAAVFAQPVALDIANTSNGIVGIYSATFDAAVAPCGASSPPYCAFFIGEPPGGFIGNPPSGRRIMINPTPTGLINGVPAGISPVPAAGSYLDLTLAADKSTVTLSGGTISVPTIGLVIAGDASTPAPTVITAVGAGMVFNSVPRTVPINASRQAEFLVNLFPSTLAVDFTTLSVAINPPGSCSGPLCALVGILTLDMFRYRLLIQYDATFGSFTGSFIGQTGNNSMVFATLNSGVPKISVNGSVPPPGPQVNFGSVTVNTTASRTVTVKNVGTGNLAVGAITQANPAGSPFAIPGASDHCSSQTLAPNATCTVDVTFTPGSVAAFSKSLNIPSNDASNPNVAVGLSGSGVAATVPNISVSDSVAPTDDQAVPFGSVAIGTLPPDQSVTVTNTGTADLIIGTLGAIAAPFSIVSDLCSGMTLVPNDTCLFGLRFEPVAIGNFNGSVDIPSNDPDQSTAMVAVSGTGAPATTPDIRVTDDTGSATDLTLEYGDVIEATSVDHSVTVTNAGTADLLIGTVGATDALAAPFSIVNDGCSGQTVAPTANCMIIVRFAPPAVAAASDSFDIPSNDPDSPSVTVSTTGNGVALIPPIPVPTPGGASRGVFGAPLDPLTLLAIPALAAATRWRRYRAKHC